jgi:hypothetical protein
VSQDLISANVDSEVVILHLGRGEYFSLNTTGACVWDLLKKRVDVRMMCVAISKAFGIAPEQCRADVSQFLEDLQMQGLIIVE